MDWIQQELAAELRDHKRLQEISCQLIPAGKTETLCADLIDAAVEVMEADLGTMQTLDPETGDLCILYVRGLSPGAWTPFRRLSRDARTSCAEALRRSERVIVDYAHYDRMGEAEDARVYLDLGIRTAQSTPLVTRSGRVIGMLSTHWTEFHRIPQRKLHLLDVLARQAADLIERKEIEEALLERDRQKDEFLAILAHELRNPLGPIRTAASLLPTVRDDPEQFAQISAIIARQTSTIGRLIDDLLDMNRITSGKVELRRELVDLPALITDTVNLVRPMYKQKGVKLSFESAEPITMDGDPVRIAQILENLLTNACKHTREGGNVRVHTEPVGNSVVIRVRDDGAGIAQDELSQIFEMFKQSTRSEDDASGGLGVGLPLARTLAEMHGGTVTASSPGPGRGSEFTVRLPLAGATTPTEPVRVDKGTHTRDSPDTGRRLRVLLVDDYPDALEPMQMLLEFEGYEVHTAETGERALDVAEECRPDVVVLDIGLPGINGYEVAQRIRARPWGEDIHLLALTGWGQPADRERTNKAGFDDHLVKPVDMAHLKRRIRQAIPAS